MRGHLTCGGGWGMGWGASGGNGLGDASAATTNQYYAPAGDGYGVSHGGDFEGDGDGFRDTLPPIGIAQAGDGPTLS